MSLQFGPIYTQTTITEMSVSFQPGQRVYTHYTVLFLAQKYNQNTWFSATLDFSLVFRWFSAVSPTLCTIIFKKTKLSCFGGYFPWFFKSKQLLGFLGVVYMLK
jgi:hypothetical protein